MRQQPILLLVFVILSCCFWTENSASISAEDTSSKIHFNLSELSPEGLIGSADSLRALSYEFCLPAQPIYVLEIVQIDPTVQIYPNSPGRIRCTAHEYLCIGNTHQPHWRETLMRLANLPYIKSIEPFFAE